MTNEYVEYQLEARWNAAQRATQWLTAQLDKLRLKLQSSENQLQAYSRSAGLLFTGDKTNVEQEKLAQLQAELSRATADRVSKQASYEIAATSAADTVPQVLDNGRLSAYLAQIADLRRQAAEMGASMTPEHYRVQRVQAQLKELEATFQRERGNILERVKNELGTEDPDPQFEGGRVDALVGHGIGDVERIGRGGEKDGGAEVLHDLDLA